MLVVVLVDEIVGLDVAVEVAVDVAVDADEVPVLSLHDVVNCELSVRSLVDAGTLCVSPSSDVGVPTAASRSSPASLPDFDGFGFSRTMPTSPASSPHAEAPVSSNAVRAPTRPVRLPPSR